MTAWTQDLIYAGDPVIIMAVALPKGHFPGGKPRPGGAGGALRPDTRVCLSRQQPSRWGAPRSTCQLLPKAKAWRRKKCRSGGVYYKARRGTTNRRVCGLSFSLRFPLYRSAAERLFIRNFFTLQDRLDLTHEFCTWPLMVIPPGLMRTISKRDPTIINGLMLCERFFFRCYCGTFACRSQ